MKLGSSVTNAINESLAYSKKVVEDMVEKCTRSSLRWNLLLLTSAKVKVLL